MRAAGKEFSISLRAWASAFSVCAKSAFHWKTCSSALWIRRDSRGSIARKNRQQATGHRQQGKAKASTTAKAKALPRRTRRNAEESKSKGKGKSNLATDLRR